MRSLLFVHGDSEKKLAKAQSCGADVLILDLRLPSLSGLSILQRLRADAETVAMPVIVVSGAVDFEARAALGRRSQRADSILEKPLDLGRLFDEVEQAAWSAPRPAAAVGPT